MSESAILVVLGAAVLAALLYPLLRRAAGPVPPRATPRPTPAPEAGDLPDELAELDLDFKMGRLSEADYTELRQRALERVPAPANPAVERAAGPASPAGDEPPPVVAAPRAGRGDRADRGEALVRRERQRARAECPSCGVRPEPGARYCSSCGTRLATCPSCGERLPSAGARFCPGCGRALEA